MWTPRIAHETTKVVYEYLGSARSLKIIMKKQKKMIKRKIVDIFGWINFSKFNKEEE